MQPGKIKKVKAHGLSSVGVWSVESKCLSPALVEKALLQHSPGSYGIAVTTATQALGYREHIGI